MRFKGTAALLLLLFVLGGYVYWTDVRGRDERERAEAEAVRVLPVEAGEIDRIRLSYPDAAFEVRRTGAGWEFVDPPAIEAASAEWDTLAGNVGRIEFDEVVTAPSADLSQFGLEDPRVRIDVVLADGTTESVLFGRENPGGNFHYVKRESSDDVLLAATSWSGLFEKDLAAMRDKTILHFDQDAVDGIDVLGATRLSLEREDGIWQLHEPVDWRADQSRVTTLLGTLAFSRALDFADELSDEQAGFDTPSWRVVLESGDIRHELTIGDPVATEGEEPRYYARDASRSAIFLIDAELPEMLGRPTIDWRDRRIARFDRDRILSIEIDGEAGIRLSRADAGGPWTIESGEEADAGTVVALLDALEFEQATAIVDDPGPPSLYGLADPRVRIVLSGAGGELLLEGALGRPAGNTDVFYWTTGGDVVYAVTRDVLDAVLLDPGELVVEDPA